jgi:predicted CopG family antitoxin
VILKLKKRRRKLLEVIECVHKASEGKAENFTSGKAEK